MSDYVRRVTAPDKPLLPRLGALDIELTERCDNDCIHCCINLPAGRAAARARELTSEQWKDVLRQAAGLGCLQVRFTGGEPLLRPDFEELYLFARRLGLKVLLFTNARQFGVGGKGGKGEQLVELLASVPPLVPLEVTVYGMHAASYEAVSRVPGSFKQFRRGLDRLVARGVQFTVKGVLLPPNRAEMDEFEAWAATLPGAPPPAAGAPWRPSYALQLDLRHRRDDPAANARIVTLRLPPDEVVRILTRDEAAYRREKNEFAARFMGPPGDRLFRCGAGQAVSIDAYGSAQPCMGVRAPELTVDVVGSSLEDALDRFESLRDIRATDPEYLRRCARCVLHGLCEQCPAKSWSEHGTLDTPVEYHCEVAHAQATFMGWLEPAERGWERTGL